MNAHYDPTLLGKIFLMKDVQKIPGICITVYTLEEIAILIQLYDGNVLKFQECNDKLYYYNMKQGVDSRNKKTKFKSSVTNHYPNPSTKFVSTVKENKDFFTKRDTECANAAQNLQEYIGWPSTQALKFCINNNLLLDCSTGGQYI